LDYRSHRSKRVLRSTLAGEAAASDSACDHGTYINHFLTELLTGNPCTDNPPYFTNYGVTDCRSLVDAVGQSTPSLEERRTIIDVASIRQELRKGHFKWVPSEYMVADGLTKLDKLEFRSIHAWDGNRAIVATAGQPAVIMKTLDGGNSWLNVYENLSPQAFFDGMRFFDDQNGLAFSDPVDGCLLIVKSLDGGNSWSVILPSAIPKMEVGEAGFAGHRAILRALSLRQAWLP
jgi:hypothetical protein